jgi:NADH-quinone oxidoreductase subunit N
MLTYLPILPELFVLSMSCIILLIDLYCGQKYQNLTYSLTQLTLLSAAAISLYLFDAPTVTLFSQHFILDKTASLLKILVYAMGFACFVYGRHYIKLRQMPNGEYYVLGLLCLLGCMVLVSANSFLTLYLGIEILSLPLYALVAIRKDSAVASEAALKYLVMGTLASGILLYGISLFYGATGQLILPAVKEHLSTLSIEHNLVLTMGLVFVVVGIAFKLGAVPFHMWIPDVYEGAPDSVTLFISGAPKLASLGLALRLLVDAMPALVIHWQPMLIIIAVLSMALGNIVAIVQNNIKRMLAYSAIAQIGYISLGLVAATPEGYAAAIFYMINYVIMAIGAFGIMVMLSKSGFEAEDVNDFKGLNTRNPWLAFMMLLIMFSLAGIPPMVGFFAKLGVLQALINADKIWLAAVALVFAIIGAYYYLRVVKVMYFEAPDDPSRVSIAKDSQVMITINGLALLVLGLFPGSLLTLCRMVMQSAT